MITTGQILPTHPFGQALIEEADQARTILEIGFGSGLGSTQCLIQGMRETSGMISIEADREQFEIGKLNIRHPRIHVLHGTLHKLIRPYYHPLNTIQHFEEYQHCQLITEEAPVLELFWPYYDLVLLDGGEYTSDGDFLKFWARTRVFALDDCNPKVATKNCYAVDQLEKAGWQCLRKELEDRNGWAMYRNPNL